jgi:hypothetical protein
MSGDPAMFTELMELFQRWWRDERLTPAQRRMVRTAILFDRMLSAGRDAHAVLGHLRRRRLLLAARRTPFAVRKVARMSLTAGMWAWSGSPLHRIRLQVAV